MLAHWATWTAFHSFVKIKFSNIPQVVKPIFPPTLYSPLHPLFHFIVFINCCRSRNWSTAELDKHWPIEAFSQSSRGFLNWYCKRTINDILCRFQIFDILTIINILVFHDYMIHNKARLYRSSQISVLVTVYYLTAWWNDGEKLGTVDALPSKYIQESCVTFHTALIHREQSDCPTFHCEALTRYCAGLRLTNCMALELRRPSNHRVYTVWWSLADISMKTTATAHQVSNVFRAVMSEVTWLT